MVFIQMTEYEPYIHSGIHQFNISFDRVWWDVDGETRQTFLPELLPGKNGTSVSVYRWLLLPSVFFFSSFVRYTHTQANVSRVSSHLNKKVIFLCINIFIHVIWKGQGSDKIEKSWFLGDCICIHCKLQAVQVSTCRQHYTRQHTYQNY